MPTIKDTTGNMPLEHITRFVMGNAERVINGEVITQRAVVPNPRYEAVKDGESTLQEGASVWVLESELDVVYHAESMQHRAVPGDGPKRHYSIDSHNWPQGTVNGEAGPVDHYVLQEGKWEMVGGKPVRIRAKPGKPKSSKKSTKKKADDDGDLTPF